MQVDYDRILSVLAMFDPKDIPYIKSEIFLKFEEDYLAGNISNKEEKVKVKKIGGKNDRSRK